MPTAVPSSPTSPRPCDRRSSQAVRDYDLVLLNAGASAGSKDFSAAVLGELGEVVVHGVNIKPGKPVILAIVEGKPVVGLPGYPISAVLTMRLFVKRLIYNLQGLDEPKAAMAGPLSRGPSPPTSGWRISSGSRWARWATP